MTIEKNDPHYEKISERCCLDKNADIQTKIDIEPLIELSSGFEDIQPIANNLIDVICKYDIDDLIIAIFCLNSWRRNRSALAQRLSLNLALSKCNSFGTQHIKSYSELEMFYNKISSYLSITRKEDYIIDDYGEVFINHSGRTYPIITGTGHQQVYGAIRYMQTLVTICNCDKELITILEYIHTIIRITKKTNISNSDCIIVFELPSEEFWNTIREMFDNSLFQEKVIAASQIVGQQVGPIEMRHFIKKESRVFPLFNESILVDYYKILLSRATPKEKECHIIQTILSLVENSFNFSPNTPNRVLIKPAVINRKSNKQIISNGILFATPCKEDCFLIAIDKNSMGDDYQLQTVIQQIAELNHAKSLRLVERIERKDDHNICGVDIGQDFEIVYMIVDPYSDITTNWSLCKSFVKYFECNALDAVYILGFSNNLNEVVDFIRFSNTNQIHISTFGGMSNYFFTWKELNRVISSGAIEYDRMIIDHNETEEYVYSYFKSMLCDFPRNNANLFNDPLNWTAETNCLNYVRILHKGCQGFGGEIKALNNNIYIFMAHNAELFTKEDYTQDTKTAVELIDALNQCLFARHDDAICDIDILKGRTLQILFIPWQYAINHSCGFLHDSPQTIVFSDVCVELDRIIIRYTVNPKVILSTIQSANNRQAENTYLIELLQPLYKYSPTGYKHLEKKLAQDSSFKKTFGVLHVEQNYYFSDKSIPIRISAVSFVRAKKEIAKVCLKSEVKSGEYHGKMATEAIRKMQKSTIDVFEKYIARYDKYHLHKKVLNYHSIQQNEIFLNIKRCSAFTDLSEEANDKFKKEIIKNREECRRNVRTSEYLLESNLSIEHQKKTEKCSMEDFEFLLAFADWLVALQDCADICHHTDSDLTITINHEYKVEITLNEIMNKKYDMLISRKYNLNDYQIKYDEVDMKFLENAIDAFNQDTGIDMIELTSFIHYMQQDIVQDVAITEVYPNVFEIEKLQLEHKFNEFLENKIDIDTVDTLIDFLTLNTTALKKVNNKQHEVLPIWEREKRDNRFNVKPLIMQDNKCIFSPVAMNNVLESWKNGITNWHLPYEIGLPKLKSTLEQWKKRYEKEMVQDIAQAFRVAEFDVVAPEVDLIRRFPQEDYPKELGDYDIIAISNCRHEVWIIESKVLQRVESIYEDQMQQKSFFYQHKDDEKFQRRIDYMMKNKKKILASFNIDGLESEYNIIPYMVTNKLFTSKYKEVAFPIITYGELMQILNIHN